MKRHLLLIGATSLVLGFVAAPSASAAPDSTPIVILPPKFQMPFFYNQTWLASTYNGHAPNQNSIDLQRFINGGNVSLNEPVVASAAGTVTESYKGINSDGKYYGNVVVIEHVGGWKTSYVHLSDQGVVAKGTVVVRGQRIAKVGQFPDFPDMAPHLHYTQLKNDVAVRVSFDGTPINVHAGAEKPDGTYPTQNLTSKNKPTSCATKPITRGGSVTCTYGAGVRIKVSCENPIKDISYTATGPRVSAGIASGASCQPGHYADGYWYDES